MVNELSERIYNCDSQCRCIYMSKLSSQCKIDGQAVLSTYGYGTGNTGKWVGILLAIIVVYRVLAGLALWARKT